MPKFSLLELNQRIAIRMEDWVKEEENTHMSQSVQKKTVRIILEFGFSLVSFYKAPAKLVESRESLRKSRNEVYANLFTISETLSM